MRNNFFPILLFLVQGEQPLSQTIPTNPSNLTLPPLEDESSTSSWILLELTGNSSFISLHQSMFEAGLRRRVADLTETSLENVTCNSVTLGPEILVNMTVQGPHYVKPLSDLAQDGSNLVDMEGAKFYVVSIVASNEILSSRTLTSKLSSGGKDMLIYLWLAGVLTLLVSSFLLFMVCRFIQLKGRGEDKRRAEFSNTYLHFPQISYSSEIVNNHNIVVSGDNASPDRFFCDLFTTLNFTEEDFMPRYLKTEISRQSWAEDGECGEPPPLENIKNSKKLNKLSTFSDNEDPPPLESVYKFSTKADVKIPFRKKISPLEDSSLSERRTTCPALMFREELISPEDTKAITSVRLKRSVSPSSTAPASSYPGVSPRSSYSPKSFSSIANSSVETLPSQDQIDKHVNNLFQNIKLKLTLDQNENVSMDEVVSN